ncbi:hypothetical protein LCGC14_1961450, partial [marine sediment metagenome]
MFDIDNCGIPKDKIDYVRKMIKDAGVKIIVKPSETNPYLDIGAEKERADILTKRLGKPITPKDTSEQNWHHQVLTLIKGRVIRNIHMSTHAESRDKNGLLIPNPVLVREKGVPPDVLPLYLLMGWFGTLRSDWESLMDDDIFKWVEIYNGVDLLENPNSYVYDAFEYMKDMSQVFVDIFGKEQMDRAIRDLSVCG